MVVPLNSLPDDRGPEFSRLLDELLGLHPLARDAWLAGLGPEHAGLCDLLRKAAEMRAEQRATPMPSQPHLARQDIDDPWTFTAGRPVGPYRLVAPLGQGGMGEVWSAQRIDGSVNREVALKLPHTWLLTAGARLRLGRERDFLAGLSHPNIAQLFDAGIADDGQPWMALEKVDGSRIDVWCRDRKLPIRDRLRLFLQVLDAVSAAHARLIVHRDLKPSNILVTDDGRVKLLDFGIAKLTDHDGRGDLTEITRIAGRVATPEYAAPEQLSGDTVTAATDVYSLGVVLHELLCGRRPRPSRRKSERSPESDDAPLPASTFAGPDFPAQISLDIPAWRRAVRGDLDAILMQALATAPRDRYPSVERLADDLRRHLACEPITARRIARLERASKFVRRNRLALVSAIVVSGSLTVGGGISLWQAQRATHEANRAMAEAARANATRDFLLKVFRSSSRIEASTRAPGSITAREMLDEIVDGLDADLARQPEVQLELLVAARALYRQWYMPDRAIAAHARYRALVTRIAGPLDARIIDSLVQEAATLYESDRDAEAVARLRETRPLIEQGDHLGTVTEADWLQEWTRTTQPLIGVRLEVIDGFQRAAEIYRQHAEDGPRARWNQVYLAMALLKDSRPEQALAMARALRVRQREAPQANDWQVANTLMTIGSAARRLGDSAAAEAALTESAQLINRTFGRGYVAHWQNFVERVDLLSTSGRNDDAMALIGGERRLLESLQRGIVPAGESPLDASVISENLALLIALKARLLADQGDCGIATKALSEAIPAMAIWFETPLLGDDARVTLADCLLMQGHAADAMHQLDIARTRYATLDSYHEPGLVARERWAEVHWRHGGKGAAETAVTELEAVLAAAGDRRLPVLARARMTLAEIAAAQGDASRARSEANLAMAALADAAAATSPSFRAALRHRHAALSIPR